MTALNILTFPDPRLRKVAAPVIKFDKSLKKLTEDMLETMYQGNGIGLAAMCQMIEQIQRYLLILNL